MLESTLSISAREFRAAKPVWQSCSRWPDLRTRCRPSLRRRLPSTALRTATAALPHLIGQWLPGRGRGRLESQQVAHQSFAACLHRMLARRTAWDLPRPLRRLCGVLRTHRLLALRRQLLLSTRKVQQVAPAMAQPCLATCQRVQSCPMDRMERCRTRLESLLKDRRDLVFCHPRRSRRQHRCLCRPNSPRRH